MSRKCDPILQILLSYAENDANIRAVLMEGSRAFGEVDAYSDYDIVYVTQNSEPYFGGAILPFLQAQFGEIAVMQTPDNGDPRDVYTHLVQFMNGVRIDLTFNSLDFLSRAKLESATRVLLDKDARFAALSPPSDADFWVQRPAAEEFRKHCNEFWWVSPYVSKAVARNQTLHALELLNEIIRKEYIWMLTQLAASRGDWNRVKVGKHGTYLKRYLLPEDTYLHDALLHCPASARPALDTLMQHYCKLSATVAEALGYPIDGEEAEKTMQFISKTYDAIKAPR
ncbi:MAG: aminoglycoside 6-adenylyltransferase [Clostridiales bacterium]|nr:aminoglycoside 6-adenylyltransferase [Clostridiales bacterium]